MEGFVPSADSNTVIPSVTIPNVSWDSGSRPPNAHWDPTVSSDTCLPGTSHTQVEASLVSTQPSLPPPEKRGPLAPRHRPPPPVLLSSLSKNPPLTSANPESDYLKLVEQVTDALVDGSMDEDCDQDADDDDASEDSDDHMSEEE